MPTLNVEGFGTFEVESGKRLVNALEDNGVDILHRCGGFAKCTTCRVEFRSGEPSTTTEAEKNKLNDAGLVGQVRLSCQLTCDQDMEVRPVNLFSLSGLSDPGPRCADEVTPSTERQPVD